LGLGLWQGEYRGKERQWLRWYDPQGNWIPTTAEKEQQERHEKELALSSVEKERQEKELAQARAERLAERLRQAGIDPDQI